MGAVKSTNREAVNSKGKNILKMTKIQKWLFVYQGDVDAEKQL